jgi:predicted nuclease of predicted toxin-antitoxin system
LDLARREGRVIVTHDVDFSALLALGGYDRPSLITLRLLDTAPDLVTRRLRQVLPKIEAALSKGSAITIDDKSVRIRGLPIL